MSENKNVKSIQSNSPITDVPLDYYPDGSGFWFQIPEGLDAGKKMFYRDSTHGVGEHLQTIVFIHGNPENSYTYRDVIRHVIDSSKKPIRIVRLTFILMLLYFIYVKR